MKPAVVIVGPGLWLTGVDRQRAGHEADVDPGVAVDVVGASAAVDLVVARAARQVVAGLAADDQVVAGAAVGREPDARQVAARRVADDVGEEQAGRR
jgi:hypothetical protein